MVDSLPRAIKIEEKRNGTEHAFWWVWPDSLNHWIGYFTPEAYACIRCDSYKWDRSDCGNRKWFFVQCFHILIKLWSVLCHQMYGMAFKHIRPNSTQKKRRYKCGQMFLFSLFFISMSEITNDRECCLQRMHHDGHVYGNMAAEPRMGTYLNVNHALCPYWNL